MGLERDLSRLPGGGPHINNEDTWVRIMILSILTAIVLALAAASVLSSMQQPAYEAYATSSVRIGDPGDNLVGRR